MRVVLARAELGWLAGALTALQVVADTFRSSATIVIARPQRRPVLITGGRMHAALAMATGEADGYCGSSVGTVRPPNPADGAGRRAVGSQLAILMAACSLSVIGRPPARCAEIKSWARRRFFG